MIINQNSLEGGSADAFQSSTSKEEIIYFRPHHFLCALFFEGKGYSSIFIDNFQKIIDKLNSDAGDNTIIRIIRHTDSICDPCPQRQGRLCMQESKIKALDTAHEQALNLINLTTIKWGDVKKKVACNITLEIFNSICAGCSWKELGICERKLTRFLVASGINVTY